MTQKPVLAHQNQFFGLSYVDSYRQDFKHLQTDFSPRGLSRASRLALIKIPSAYVAQPPGRSMVTKERTAKANPRSAGSARPQNTGRTVAPSPLPPARTSHGSNARTASSLVNNMRYSPDPIDESDSCSDCYTCSEDEHETDFSSRATSPDDEFDSGEDELARRKRQIVDASMLLFRLAVYKWFAQVCGVVTHNGEGGRGTKRSADEISGRQWSSSSSTNPPAGGKKRQLRNKDGSGVGEEEDSDQEGGGGKKKAKRDRKFACPFFKRDPEKYKAHKTCLGPGWDTTHRVKEHLWRRHVLPTYMCPDCNAAFKTNDEFAAHFRTAYDCSKDKKSSPDGIDAATEKLLRARQRGHMTEEEKWVFMYKTLFPDEDVIPSPYQGAEAKTQTVDPEIRRMARFIKDELFPNARRALLDKADREFEGVKERMKLETFDAVQDAVLKLIQFYERGSQQQGSPAFLPSNSLPSSPRPDSGLATPEPQETTAACVQQHPQLFDFSTGFEDSNYTYGTSPYDLFFTGAESFPQSLPDILAAGSGNAGCASGNNEDFEDGTVGGVFAEGDLISLGLGPY